MMLELQIQGTERHQINANGFNFNIYYKPQQNNEGILICHHGIGSCALTFARFLVQLHEINPDLGFLIFDARHHGYTEPANNQVPTGKVTDLDIDTLVGDLEAITAQILPQTEEPLHIMLLGHSMGGTLMAQYANHKPKPANYDVRGLIVVDAVEGHARQSLRSMHALLSMWPSSFKDEEEAITWHLRQGNLLRSRESAKMSIPPILRKDPVSGRLVWKLDLNQTESNWANWFANLDELFLSAPMARLLVLAGMAKLDTALTRAQMQGKFQLRAVNGTAHYIQEDAPSDLAMIVSEFWIRNGKPIQIIPKFGQIRTN